MFLEDVEIAEEKPNEYSELILIPGFLIGGFAIEIEPTWMMCLLLLHGEVEFSDVFGVEFCDFIDFD